MHAVARAGLADRLDDVAGQGADVGAPVAADLGLVVHAAQADAHELATHGAGDRLAERGLADARRADEAQDRRLAFGRQLAHRQILDDALLDLLETEMIVVQDAARLGDVDRQLPRAAPRAARPASRDRCGSCRIRPRPRACVFSRAQLLARGLSRPPRGMPALAIACSSSASSAVLPSSSPSWRWIAAICSRSSISRWRSSSEALVWRPISCDSRSTSIRCASRRATLSIRAVRGRPSRGSPASPPAPCRYRRRRGRSARRASRDW